jgi:hypothetical protein
MEKELSNYLQRLPAGVNTTVSLHANVSPHSFEFGPANARHKIYYSDYLDLEAKIKVALDGEKFLADARLAQGGGQ